MWPEAFERGDGLLAVAALATLAIVGVAVFLDKHLGQVVYRLRVGLGSRGRTKS